MGRPLILQIRESREELESRLDRETQANFKERLQMLYWLKCDLVTSRQEIALLLHHTEGTITGWFNRYRQGGIEALLHDRTAPGQPCKIPEPVVEQLKQRLQQPGEFHSYRDIHEWIVQEHQLDVSYAAVYALVRHRLQAKLKRPRSHSAKPSPSLMERLNKNSA